MEPTTTYRPRISRETRLLLTAAVLAVLVLWLLARVRFRDRPAPPSPIPAVLSQLSGRPQLDELATEVAGLAPRLRPSVVALTAGAPTAGMAGGASRIPALRWRGDVAVAWLPPWARGNRPDLIALDRAAGLALVRTTGAPTTASPAPWVPRGPLGPRYLVVTDVVANEVSFRPAFIAAFESVATPLWPQPVWAVPAGSDLSAGSVVFTSNADLVGLVIAFAGQRVIVPAATLLAHAERLLDGPQAAPGTLGIEVQALTPALASTTGASAGVITTWVDQAGAAHGQLRVGEVIEAVDGRPVTSRGDWDAVAARLSAGQTVTLRVRNRGTVRDVPLVAAPATAPATDALGLTLRARAETGAEIVDVEPGSAGERAGLAPSDVITLIGDVPAPTPRQVTRAFTSLRAGERAIVGFSRGDAHLVTTVERSK